jgi:hypothetical protein
MKDVHTSRWMRWSIRKLKCAVIFCSNRVIGFFHAIHKVLHMTICMYF